MIKIILSILIVACSSYIGWGVQKYYKNRITFYENLDNLLHFAMNNICFYKDDINTILTNYIKTSNDSKHLKSIIMSVVNDKSNFDTVVIKKEEKQLLLNIFNYLGKSDSENQIAGLTNFSKQVQFVLNKCREEYNNLGKISTKLGVLFGIALAICLL